MINALLLIMALLGGVAGPLFIIGALARATDWIASSLNARRSFPNPSDRAGQASAGGEAKEMEPDDRGEGGAAAAPTPS